MTDDDIETTDEREESRLALLGRTARGVAHDLAGYMTAIGGFAELLTDEVAAGRDGKEEIAEILRAVQRASHLIDSMLELGEAHTRDAGTMGVGCDPRKAIGRLGAMIRSLVGKGIRLTLNLESSPPAVAISELELDRLVLNLSDNARKAMRGEGSLRICVVPTVVGDDSAVHFVSDDWETASRIEIPGLHPQRPSEVRPGASRVSDPLRPSAGRYAALVVSDDGCGMESDLRERIFLRLAAADESGNGEPRAQASRSHGLGLANVAEIARARSGGLRVWSAEGRGTSVCVLLPIAPVAKVTALLPQTDVRPDAARSAVRNRRAHASYALRG